MIIGGVAFWAVWKQLPTMGALVGMPPGRLVATLCHTIFELVLQVGGALVLVAVADFAWQKRKHEKSLKMSREEVQREAKEADLGAGDEGRRCGGGSPSSPAGA